MRPIESVAIGAIVGIVYGILLWFIRSQVIYIYSQGIPFSTYYDPNLVAFTGAMSAAILCLLVIFSYQYIYSFFEWLAVELFTAYEDEE